MKLCLWGMDSEGPDMRRAADQNSLCICAVRPGPSLLIDILQRPNASLGAQRMPLSNCANTQVDLGLLYSQIAKGPFSWPLHQDINQRSRPV